MPIGLELERSVLFLPRDFPTFFPWGSFSVALSIELWSRPQTTRVAALLPSYARGVLRLWTPDISLYHTSNHVVNPKGLGGYALSPHLLTSPLTVHHLRRIDPKSHRIKTQMRMGRLTTHDPVVCLWVASRPFFLGAKCAAA